MNKKQTARTALAQRAIALPAWVWHPGMLTLPFHEDGDRSKPVCLSAWRVRERGVASPYAYNTNRWSLPDLDDPATLGWLLHMTRQAWGPTTNVCPKTWPGGMYFQVWRDDDGLIAQEDTEGKALIAALEMHARKVAHPERFSRTQTR